MINQTHSQKEKQMAVTLQPKPNASSKLKNNPQPAQETKQNRKPLNYKSSAAIYQANKKAWKHYISQKPSGASSGWGNLAWQHLAYLIVQGRYARVKKAFSPLNEKNAISFSENQGRSADYKLTDAAMTLKISAKSLLYNLRREKQDVIYYPDIIHVPFRGNIVNTDGSSSTITMSLEVTKEVFEEIMNLPTTSSELLSYLAGLKNTKD